MMSGIMTLISVEILYQFFHVPFSVGSEYARFFMEVFFSVAIWTEPFEIFRVAIQSVFVNVMKVDNFWNLVVSTSLAFTFSDCCQFFSLSVGSYCWCIQTFLSFESPATFSGTKVSFSVLEFVRKPKENFSADHARFFNPGDSF